MHRTKKSEVIQTLDIKLQLIPVLWQDNLTLAHYSGFS